MNHLFKVKLKANKQRDGRHEADAARENQPTPNYWSAAVWPSIIRSSITKKYKSFVRRKNEWDWPDVIVVPDEQ